MAIVLFAITSLFFQATAFEYPFPHLPDAPGEILHQYLKTKNYKQEPLDPIIEPTIQAGAKNLAWLRFLNAARSPKDQIQLTNPGDLPKYPIEAPSYNSPKLITEISHHIQKNMPEKMRQVIYENGEMSLDMGTNVAEYIRWARLVDDNYADATRWKGMAPYLNRYAEFSYRDIRGYYYLTKEEDLAAKLKVFSSLTSDKQEELAAHLVGICHNTKLDKPSCRKLLMVAIDQNTVFDFYQKYNVTAETMYYSYFRIPQARTDVTWDSSTPNLATVPFRHTSAHIEKFLSDNIEEEWQWKGWNLRLNFTTDAALHVEFIPNVLPHVPEGNTIVMDENAPLTEWNVRWTIRHEFGHTIGFRDCYVEYYDLDLQEMVNYQLDITDIMCSRDGKFQEKHYKELRRVYYKD